MAASRKPGGARRASRLSNAPAATAQATGQSQPLSALEIGHVLSAEIVDYSMLSMDQQTRLLGRLVRIISETPEFGRSQGEHLVGLPTAEGMTLVFFGDPVAPVRCATEIARALQSYPEMKLRMGIHSGPVYRMGGIYARVNVAGDGIKTAQRIMSVGAAGHILVSKPVADTLSGLGSWAKCLHNLGERELTPGARLQLFNLYTGEVGNPEQPGELSATIVSPTTAATPAAAPAIRRKLRPVIIITASAFALAAAITGYLTLKHESAAAQPLLTTEFAETFINLDRWKIPPSGWTFANQSLQIENQPIIGYPPEVNCADFTMTFHLKLLTEGGAAWALRVQDPDSYYLFYLSGRGGMNPNTFLTYVVQNAKTLQKHADSVVVHLVPGGEYQIRIEAKNNQISHKIRTDATGPEFQDELADERRLGLFQDVDNTYRAGSIGFLTFGTEKFAVSGLYVRPPGVQVPE